MTFMCNFIRTLETDLKPTHTCHISGDLCSGSNCILQRILAALPAASPIVAQAMDAMEESASGITITQGVNQTETAKLLGVSGPTISILSKHHGIGRKINGRKYYTSEDMDNLRKHLKHGRKSRGEKKKAPAAAETTCLEARLVENIPSPALAGEVLLYYQEHGHIKMLPEVVASKLHVDAKQVRKACEMLNERGALCFAGNDGYYSRPSGAAMENLRRNPNGPRAAPGVR